MSSALDQLRVYQQAKRSSAQAYTLAGNIPDAALRDQIRRAATSVVFNISEGRGRASDADFARHLAIARGSNHELDAQMDFCGEVGMVEVAMVSDIRTQIGVTGKMLTALINQLRSGGT